MEVFAVYKRSGIGLYYEETLHGIYATQEAADKAVKELETPPEPISLPLELVRKMDEDIENYWIDHVDMEYEEIFKILYPGYKYDDYMVAADYYFGEFMGGAIIKKYTVIE